MKIIKIERPDVGGGWVGISEEQLKNQPNFLQEEMMLMFTEEEAIGSQITITLTEITDEEFGELQTREFQGW